MLNKGHTKDSKTSQARNKNADVNDFVLEQHIFSNIFDKDIKRVFIYKKAERLAKAIHLIVPAFRDVPSLRDRIDAVAVRLVDASILPPSSARDMLSRELLALSSMLSIARTSGILSVMNAELIAKEAQTLLLEVATYEEPRLFLDDTPSLAELARDAGRSSETTESLIAGNVDTRININREYRTSEKTAPRAQKNRKGRKGHLKDTSVKSSRRDAILNIIRTKGDVYIKDISTVIRNVSEKTIQRELATLVEEGVLIRTGSRRWTSYSIAG